MNSIGIFDSGVGGLTVVKEIIRLLPDKDIVYFGDTARLPYGTKSRETIVRFSIENVRFLLRFNVQIIISACNTASSLALDVLQKTFPLPIIDVIHPAVKAALQSTRNSRIGIIATKATISSQTYPRLIHHLAPHTTIFTQSCPLFVPLVEEGWVEEEITYNIARRYLEPLKKKGIDTLILACTHYPLLKEVIKKVMGEVKLIDSAIETACEIADMFPSSNDPPRKGRHLFYVSDDPAGFRQLGERFLGQKIDKVNLI